MKKILTLFLVLCMLLPLSGYSGSNEEIKATLTEFQYACQNLDVKAMLNCIDSDISRPVSNGLSVLGLFLDTDAEDLVEEVFDLLFDWEVDPYAFLSGIEFSDIKIEEDGDTAVVNCILVVEISGERLEYDSEIDMIQVDDHWYISNVRFP